MDALIHDLRQALRALHESPGHSASVVVSLAIGVALALALLSLAEFGATRPLRPAFADDAVQLLRAEGGSREGDIAFPSYAAVIGAAVPADRAAEEVQWSPTVETIAARQRAGLRGMLAGLGAATLLALGVALGNATILLLARATARRQEMTLRRALGASRGRLLRVSLLEAAMMAVAGCGAGAGLGAGGVALLRRHWPAGLALDEPLRITPGAMLIALGVPIALMLLCGLAPLALTPRRELSGALLQGRREGELRSALAVLAVSASVVLLSGAGVLLRGVAPRAAEAAELEPARMVTLRLALAPSQYADHRDRAAYYEAVLGRISALPEVEAKSIASPGSWEGLGTTDRVRAICGLCSRGGLILAATEGPARHHAVSAGYFDSLRIRVVRGREFTSDDRLGTATVAVINEAFANRLFPNADPLGKQVRVGGDDGTWHTVVGVVRDTRARGIGSAGEPQSAIYLPLLQHPPRAAAIAVRFAAGTADAPAALDRAVRAAGPGLALAATGTLAGEIARFAAPLRWFGVLFGTLGAAAVLLATAGIFAVISYLVSQRTWEIGVHKALGARRRDLLRMVMAESGSLVTAGSALGVLGAVGLARVLQVLFYGIDPLDPAVYAGVALLLGGVAAAGSIVPARRAARMAPVAALRHE